MLLHGPPALRRHTLAPLEEHMDDVLGASTFQESKIEEEPILGTVLRLPDGRIQTLTLIERILVTLRILNAKKLEARYS
jgi:hypothetical protein